MNSCSMIRRPRSHSAALGVLLGLIAVLALGTRAQGAPASPPTKPSNAGTVSISGANLRHTLTFRQSKQPAQYARLLAEVSWMDGRAADIIPSRPPNLGPHYLVVTQNGSKTTGKYDLYPEVPGGPLAHRQALGSQPAAWFYAPIDMASVLASLGVTMPTSAPTDTALAHPTIATTALKHSLTSVARESVTALWLAALGCVAILILLGFAARRSHAVDRRRTLSPAMGRLAEVSRAAARGRGAVVRGATPPGAAFGGAGPAISATPRTATQGTTPHGTMPHGAAPGSRPAAPPNLATPPNQATPPEHAASSGSSDGGTPSLPGLAALTAPSAPIDMRTRVARAKLVAGAHWTRWRSRLPSPGALPRPRRASDRQRS